MAGLLLCAVVMGLICISSAYDFPVGGRDGWVQNPRESYNNWAQRRRFQVNDTLVFKYNKAEDSVLVVKKEDYDSCNVKNPIQKLEGGDSVFKLNQPGPFYFISGVQDRCAKGEKLIVAVMAVRTKKPLPPPTAASPPSVSPSPIPSSQPPTASLSPSPSPSTLSPTPTVSPTPSPSTIVSPTPSPSTMNVSPTPSPSTMNVSPTPSPSTINVSPTPSPSTVSPTPSPSSSPTKAPTTSPSPSPSPSAGGPTLSPSATEVSPAQAPGSKNGGGGSIGSGPAASPIAGAPEKSSSSALTASRVSLGVLALVMAHGFLG